MLTNIKKILLFINLLNNREFVTKKDVTKFCEIGTRSFYRYTNLLSEINIPIYYDKTVRGYRLTSQIVKQQQIKTMNEVILQIISLIKLSKTMRGEFRNEINSLIKKVISMTKFNIEDIINAYYNQIQSNNTEADDEQIIKSVLIDVAVSNSFKMQVTYNNTDKITIENPRLEYKNDWLLKDSLNEFEIPIDTIRYIKII